MKKIDINDIIKDYTKIIKITDNNINDLASEISLIIKQNKDFLKETSITENGIKETLRKYIDHTNESINDMSKNVESVSNNTVNNIKKTTDYVSNTKDVIKNASDNIKETTNNIIQSSKTASLFSSAINTNTASVLGDVKNNMIGSVNDVLGDTSKYFDFSISLIKAIGLDFKNMFSSKKSKNVESDVKIIKNTILDDHKLHKQEYLSNERIKSRKSRLKKSLTKLAIISAIGLVIGGALRTIFLPFEFIINKLIKGLKIVGFSGTGENIITSKINKIKNYITDIFELIRGFKNKIKSIIKVKIVDTFYNVLSKFERLDKLFGKESSFGKVFVRIGEIFTAINNKVGLISKGLLLIGNKISIFSWFFKMIKVGFKWLGWPMQILFSLIDFIKGFAKSTKKTIFGRIEDGLTEAIVSFFEMPIRLMAWIVEKLSFGKIKNLGDDWVDLFRQGIHDIFMPLFWMKTLLWKLTGDLEPLFVKLRKTIQVTKEIIFGFFRNLYEFFTNIGKLEGISAKISGFVRIFTKTGAKLGKIFKIFGGLFPEFVSKLFWPITVFFGVMDFLTGYATSNENTFLGKIKDGLTYALAELIKWPIKILGYLIDKVHNMITGDNRTGTGNKLFKTIRNGIRFIIDWIITPVKDLFEILKFVGNLLTFDFSGAVENLKNIFHNTFDKFAQIGQWIWDLIPDGMKDLISGIFSPIIGFFVKIGDFVGKIMSYVASKLKKIPIIGKFFKSDSEKNNEKINDLIKQKQKLQQEIKEQEQEIKSGDNRTWIGQKRTTIIKNKKEDIAKIDKQLKEEKAKQGTVVYTKVNGKLKVKHDYRTEFQKSQDEDREREFHRRQFGDVYSRIQREEGYRKNLYRDSRGYWTGGYGTLISKDKSLSKRQANALAKKKLGFSESMSDDEKKSLWNKRYNKDFIRAKQNMEKYALKQGITLNKKQKDILTDMSYNMGIKKLSGFHNMWDALKKGDTNKAADEMVNSKWYGQVGDRSKKLVAEMRSSKPSVIQGINGVAIAKANLKKKEIESRNSLGESISKNMKKMNTTVASNNQTQPVIVNNNGGMSHEPPEDIESMSIIWLNKSYGLG